VGTERLRRWSEEHRGVPPAFDRLAGSFDDVVASTIVRLPLQPRATAAALLVPFLARNDAESGSYSVPPPTSQQ
jgi:hypothetical protein